MDDNDTADGDRSAAIHIGAGGRVDNIVVHGNVAGRDVINVGLELTYDVGDLQHNPYLGMASYSYATRAYFGGRERQVQAALDRLTDPADTPWLVFVTGASGCGKSSFVQAGVVPALEQARAEHAQRLQWAVMRPGRRPLAALAQALESLRTTKRLTHADYRPVVTPDELNAVLTRLTQAGESSLLIVDQFEELFTQSEQPERKSFLAMLAGLAPFNRSHTQVIATLRSDYLPALFEVEPLFEIAKHCGIELRAMSRDETAAAIRRPLLEQASREGKDKRIEPALVERLVEDMGEDATLLPLLQVTLRAMWDAPPHRLVLGRYRSLTYALEDQANLVIERDGQSRTRTDAERDELLAMLLDLVEVSFDADPRHDARRTLTKDELLAGRAARAPLLDDLVRARLVSTSVEARGESTVELVDIIHETLLHSWGLLHQRIAAEREALQQRERFRLAMSEWLEHDRSDDYLLQGVRLHEARDLSQRNDVAMRGTDGRTFLERSNRCDAAMRERELQKARRTQRILGSAAAVAVAFAASALVAVVLALGAQGRAEYEASVATSRQLAAEAQNQLSARVDLALLLSRHAYQVVASSDTRLRDSVESRSVLLKALERSPLLITFLNGHTRAVRTVAFSPDGRTIASGAADGTVRLWGASTRQALGEPLRDETSDIIFAVAFSPDGTTLASGGRSLRLWDVATRQPRGDPLEHAASVLSVAFSSDGRYLASTGGDGEVRLWDAKARQLLASLPTGDAVRVERVAFSPDGRTLASAIDDGTIQLWDVATRQLLRGPLHGHEPTLTSIAFNPDGNMLASAGGDGIRLWDVPTGRQLGDPLAGDNGAVQGVAFSPDGRTLASAHRAENTVRLWSLSGRRAIGGPLDGHNVSVNSVAFSPDGTMLASASGDFLQTAGDNSIRLWDLTDQSSLASTLPRVGGGLLRSSAISPDGNTLAVGSSDARIHLWNLTTGDRLGQPLTLHVLSVNSVAVSPDGKLLASGSGDIFGRVAGEQAAGTVRLWDLAAGTAYGEPIAGHTDGVLGVAFSPDGKTLATASADRTVRLWDVATQQPRGAPLVGHKYTVTSIAFTPDGKWLISGSKDHTVRFWDLTAREPTSTSLIHDTLGAVNSLALSRDGRTLATGSDDATVILWDVASRQPLGAPLVAHTRAVKSLAFSPDGTTLVSSGDDGAAMVWDIVTRKLMAQARTRNVGPVNAVAFTPDGSKVVAVGDDGAPRIWDAGLESWLDRACRIANRNLSRAEWEQYMRGGAPYQATCPDLPNGT